MTLFSKKDKQLVAAWLPQIQSGDRQAFEQFFRHFFNKLVRIGLYKGLPPQDAQALANDVMTVIWEKASAFRGEADPLSWLQGIAANHIADWYRNQQRRRKHEADPFPCHEEDSDDNEPNDHDASAHWNPHIEPASSDPFHLASSAEIVALMWSKLHLLSQRQRDVLLMSNEGDSMLQIANKLGIKDGTVKATLSQARAHMKRHLQEAGFDPGDFHG